MVKMMIDAVSPELVMDKASLVDRLRQDSLDAGFSDEMIHRLIDTLPPELTSAQCFHDGLTGLWRYEFGEPFYLKAQRQLLWGAHMWVPVQYLRRTLVCFLRRVPPVKRPRYLQRLDERNKHLDVLSEMMPLFNVNDQVPADFEVAGHGAANKEIDWLLGPIGGREILFDVKSRSLDLIQQMDQQQLGDTSAPPAHDASLLFRSLEQKFMPIDPAVRLQGAWLATHIKQEETELRDAFLKLDAKRVHFAILAHWEPGGLVLVRNDSERPFLCELFGIQESDRFTFRR
jgi:hypothetical protein